MLKDRGERPIPPETPKQIVNICLLSEGGIQEDDTLMTDLERALSKRYCVITDKLSTICYHLNRHGTPIQENYLENLDVIISHLIGTPELPPEALHCSEITQFQLRYPDIEDLLKLLHKAGLNIPVIIYSTYAHHCLLLTDPLIAGYVQLTPNSQMDHEKLRILINQAYKERQRQRALKLQS